MAPSMNRKLRLSCSINSLPSVAACPLPIPGRKEQRGEKVSAANDDLSNSFLVRNISLNGLIDCCGKRVLDLNDINRLERPKRPDKRGKRGSFTGRLNVKSPRIPARMNVIVPKSIFSSLIIMYIDKKMRMKGIIDLIRLKKVGKNRMKRGVTIRRMIMANIEPYNVKINASCPLPCNRSLCPGKIDKKFSSSGAPR